MKRKATSRKPTARRSVKPVPTARLNIAPARNTSPCIVGIGASAGGLEALEQFLGHVPPDCGLVFVVIQHLDPNRKGILVELLQRVTAMPVIQINDRMPVEPGRIYVIPPNYDLSILRGVLHLLEPAAPRGLRLPIDFFFRALADDQHEHAIGVILSGMGSDGTLGLRAIKEKAGAVFVQAPATAKFDDMPRSAIDAGLADVVAPAEELPGKIISFLRHVPLLTASSALKLADKDQGALEKIVLLLRTQTGHDFSLYKKSTIYRRIERRMGLHQLTRIADYARYLRENPLEAELLFKELLIGVTRFFRDPAVWEQLKTEIIPELLAAHPHGGTLRAWVPGCSTGEEAYSLAIIFREALEQAKPAAHCSLQIFATDLDKDAIGKARAAVYPANIAADVSDARLKRFFVQEEHGFRMGREIREMVTFAPQNLAMDPPFTKLDLLTCRNLLIYFETDLQKRILPLFHYSLNPEGILLLGNSETVGQSTDLFVALPGKNRFYRRQASAVRATPVEFPVASARTRADVAAAAPRSASPPNLQVMTDSLLLQGYAPAAVLTTDKGDILYFSGRTGKYLEPAAGKANLNLFAMARDGLGMALNEAFRKVIRSKTACTLKAVKMEASNGPRWVDITVRPLGEPAAMRGMVLVVFTDVVIPHPPKAPGKPGPGSVAGARLEAMARELQQSREELQTAREEMQNSQEELKSTNEEFQSTNEELQSTNEELSTSKEETQSLNEELQTVNHELQAKLDELSRSNNDMRNLLNSTDIATLFLDSEVRIRRFTTQANRLMKLIPSDVGRPITDIASDLIYPDLPQDVQDVLRTLVFVEKSITTRDGRWYTMRVMPYRTLDDKIDGVVITYSDITVAKKLEAQLRKGNAEPKLRVAASSLKPGGKK